MTRVALSSRNIFQNEENQMIKTDFRINSDGIGILTIHNLDVDGSQIVTTQVSLTLTGSSSLAEQITRAAAAFPPLAEDSPAWHAANAGRF